MKKQNYQTIGRFFTKSFAGLIVIALFLSSDGSDLAAYISNPAGRDLSLLTGDYGRSDCPGVCGDPLTIGS